jgi:hypothetical protein
MGSVSVRAGTISSLASLFFRARGFLGGRLNLISFRNQLQFQPPPVFHHPARALGDAAPNWLTENDGILANGDCLLSTSR